MMALTHGMIAAAGTSFLFNTADPIILISAIVGSQLPDIDTSHSLIGRMFWPIANWFEARYPHRTITHSLLATGTIVLFLLPIGVVAGQTKIALAIGLGHFLASFSDCFTKKGVQLFWPAPYWVYSVANPYRRLSTGSPAEYSIVVAATALLLFGMWSSSAGGIPQLVSLHLGLKEGLFQVYNQNAFTHEVWADVQGVTESDRSFIQGRYLIIGADDSEFILTDGQRIYKTNQQIIPTQLMTKVGNLARTEIQTLIFQDEEILSRLQSLAEHYPIDRVWLSGELKVDLSDEIQPVVMIDQYPTLTVSGTTVKLRYHPLKQALQDFVGHYGTGFLTIKIIIPEPVQP
ncbi:metal-dependent hydrolase [Aphanothece hegewaldii CCALA 016]|uniref:Metal-dependent hydrolase n=1 Tax=Aphanothece hegewaldii CCALA 016 TaxID=2107694 RepID=A0A2T1LUC1_9CHRO|nr:metal-dependent hydrolase [Aphanothece hegewaldii]PSF35048.1 metal-dependent hydrolase [Aphanothece hegewaldii CCALA 016]